MPSVYISFQYDEDRRYRDLLRAMNANRRFTLDFHDGGIVRAVRSEDEARVRAVITHRIKQVDATLVIIGRRTYLSDWVDFEIKRSIEHGVQLVALKLDRSYTTPPALYGQNAIWVYGFVHDKITDALDQI